MSSSVVEPPPRNRLSIAHLMLWTLGSAIALAFNRALANANPANERLVVAMRVYALVYSLLVGPEIGGLLLFAWRRLRRIAGFPTHPGHWLLVIEGASAMLAWLGHTAVEMLSKAQTGYLSYFAAGQFPNCAITAAAYILALHDQRTFTKRWNVVFVILSIEHAIAALLFGVMALPIPWLEPDSYPSFLFSSYNVEVTCFPLLLVVALVWAAARDPLRRDRDLLHWSGVATLVGTDMLQSSGRFLLQFFG